LAAIRLRVRRAPPIPEFVFPLKESFMSKRAMVVAAGVLAAAAGSASAQSTTTVYGIFDTGVEYISDVGAAKSTLVRMPGLTGSLPSRVGFRGAEELGGGLKAVYTLETGFAPDAGVLNQGGRIFGRQVFLGLSDTWGTVSVGRQWSMLFWGTIESDTMGPGNFASGSLDAYLPNARVDNSVAYRGTFGGVTVGATYSLGRDTVNAGPSPSGTNCPGESATDKSACREWSALVKYDSPVWGAAAVIDKFHGGTAGTFGGLVNSSLTDQRVSLNGYFKVAGAKLTAGVIRRNNEGSALPKTDLWWLGASYPFTPSLAFDAQIFRLNTKASSNDATMPVLRLTYSFSKRTATYATIARINNGGTSAISVSGAAPGSNPAAGVDQNGVMIGMRHSF
jgi:predicted porin